MNTKKTDELFELVKSLTSSEKRYFKIFATRHVTNDENLYLELFNWIETQESYDEELLKKDFEGSSLLKQLPVLKNYLKKNILKSLRTFDMELGTRREVNAMIDYSIILIKKRLFVTARKMIKKALKICWENDQYDQVVFLEHMNLIINRREGNIKAVRYFIDEGYQEELKAIEYQKNHLLYLRLMLDFENYYEKLGSHATEEELKPLHELIKHPLLQDENQAITFKSKGNFWDIHCKYYSLIGNQIKEYECWENIIKLHQTYPKSILEFSSHYIKALSRVIELAQNLQYYERADDLLKELYALPQQYKFANQKFVKRLALQQYHSLQIFQMLLNGKIEKALDIVNHIKENLNKTEKTDTVSEILSLYLKVAEVYLYAKNYEEAIIWTDKMLYYNSNELQSNMKIQAILISLILHYELGNEEYIISLIRSYRRKLKSRKSELSVEFQFFSTFMKLLKLPTNSEKKECYKTLRNTLVALDGSMEQAKYYNYRVIILWIESKLKKKDMTLLITKYKTE